MSDRVRLLNAVLGVVRAAATFHRKEDLHAHLLATVRDIVPADVVMIGVVERNGMFSVMAGDPAVSFPSLRAADYPASRAIAARRPVRYGDRELEEYPVARRKWMEAGWHDALAIPLLVEDEPLGILVFTSKSPDGFAAIDLEVASELGAGVAVVFDRCLAGERLAILRDQQQAENEDLSQELRTLQSADGMIGDCATFAEVKQLVDLVGPTEATVLLAGETGTGKDVVARALHEASPRFTRPLVTVNCAALPSHLAESELFGHEQGAFTGAARRREGSFERASGGTLFLDEVGELALDVQAKLLRALQERTIERVGGGDPIALDLRIIAATNRNLSEMVAARRFREDLYYRLAVFPIELPPLRARKDDIPALIEFFVMRAAQRLRVPARKVDAAAMTRLCAYEWPGNVRELQNAVERAMIVSTGDRLEIDALLPPAVTVRPRLPAPRSLLPVEAPPEEGPVRGEYLRALEASGWVIEGPGGAAARLGVHPNTLRYRLKRLGLTRPG